MHSHVIRIRGAVYNVGTRATHVPGIVVNFTWGLGQHTLVGIVVGLMWASGKTLYLLGIVIGLCGGLGRHTSLGTMYCC
jgi:hypothetical protein